MSVTAGSVRKPRRPRLSARAVKQTLQIGQVWEARDGSRWTVKNPLYRTSRSAYMENGTAHRFVPFGELAKEFRLIDGGK